MRDNDVSETEDAGDVWLTFCVCGVIGAGLSFALLQLVATYGWAAAGAVFSGAALAWFAARTRMVRRFVSHAVQMLLPWW